MHPVVGVLFKGCLSFLLRRFLRKKSRGRLGEGLMHPVLGLMKAVKMF